MTVFTRMWTRRHVMAAGAALLVSPASARPQSYRVLFIGNSFTLHHNVPRLVDNLAAENGVTLHVAAVAYNGRTLSEAVRDPQLVQLAIDIEPDILILQEHSQEPLTAMGRARSAKAMARLRGLAPNGVLFPAWPRQDRHPLYRAAGMPQDPDEMAKTIIKHHAQQARALRMLAAPIPQAWLRAAQAGMHLYSDDGYHASPAGAWLAAVTLASTMGVPVRRFETQPRGVHSATARFLAGLGTIAGS